MQRFLASLALTIAVLAGAAEAQPANRQNVVFVMIDGLRWQEVFRGADTDLAASPEYMASPWADEARTQFVDVADRRAALMPFVTGRIGTEGALVGDRDHGSCAAVTNNMWFSYPGYNEALTGAPDPRINSNEYPANPNVTWLEWLNRQPGFANRVRAVTSWDAFPRIINSERSGVPVDAGFAPTNPATPELRLLNRLLAETPYPWDVVRADAFTHHFALDAIRRLRPRALFVSYGETDDFAHEGNYAQYLRSAHQTDAYLRELWETLQASPHYAGRTTMIITVDHGRGNVAGESWRHHYSPDALRERNSPLRERFPEGVPGSNEIWIGAIGPRVKAAEADASACAGLNQIAATAITAIGLDWRSYDAGIGAPLDVFR
jgi:hypothetical protein